MKITKAVIPVAGKGTRFLPATKEVPKEMIPIINKPMIHYAVEEAVLSGITQIIFVTSSGKSAIEDYFDRNLELESFLEKNRKKDFLKEIKNISNMIEVLSVRQKEQLGLGHAILCAKDIVGNDDFAVLLGDDIILNDTPVTKQLLETYQKNGNYSVLGVMEVDPSETDKYGIVDGDFVDGSKKILKMNSMVEKPSPDKAPTRLASPGRYVLSSKIFDCLEKIERGVGGEYQLTDAINMLAKQEDVFAHIFDGDRFDTGSIAGYLDATVEFALRSDEYKSLMLDILKSKKEKFGI